MELKHEFILVQINIENDAWIFQVFIFHELSEGPGTRMTVVSGAFN